MVEGVPKSDDPKHTTRNEEARTAEERKCKGGVGEGTKEAARREREATTAKRRKSDQRKDSERRREPKYKNQAKPYLATEPTAQ